ncbi:uncharacterized protein LOC121595279 [Anopheles merus]|uniref:uncharacterized protein LOC121595279 n=1 Tax=Anopheles merus TaxID=30066 RepID=UPI001BE4002D|nr:uncharacterized protein LOC121595279 [Anopheles merus]
MMAATSRLGLTILAVVLFAASSATALRCYTCNSYDNSECFSLPANFTEQEYRDNRTIPGRLLVECPPDAQGRPPLCRKMDILVIGGSLPDHVRVVRECAYEHSRRHCYKMENGGHEERVCHCNADGCNGGSPLTLSGVLLASTGLLLRLMHR